MNYDEFTRIESEIELKESLREENITFNENEELQEAIREIEEQYINDYKLKINNFAGFYN